MPGTAAHQQQDPQSTATSPSRSNRATAVRLADAAMHARRNSCCVADFATVPVNARAADQRAQLKVSSVGDAHEREAEAAADRVSRISESALPNDVSASSTRSRDGGNIDHNTRSMMQRGFAADFSDVRLHTDGRAASMSRSLNARAFTVGRDIYFGSGEYSPSTAAGRHLLAHELTHTIQQNPARIQRSPTAQGLTGLGVNVEERAESGGGEAKSSAGDEARVGDVTNPS